MNRRIGTRALDQIIQLATITTTYILKTYALVFLFAIGAIIVEIIARYYGYATTFSVEFSGYVMASLITWGSCYALLQKAHIRIDILYTQRSDATKSLLDILAIVMFFLAAVFLAWSSARLAIESVEFDLLSNSTLRVPLWIPQTSWALGFIWLSICSGLLTVKALVSWLNQDRDSMVAAVGTGDEAPL